MSIRVFDTTHAIYRIFFIGLINLSMYLLCNLYLAPRLFSAGKYLQLIVVSLLLITASSLVRVLIEQQFVPYMFKSQQAVLISSGFKLMVIIPQAVIVFVACLLSVLKINFYKEQEYIQLKIIEANRELELIKAKINPHFLLNTLNNIYAINYDESPKTSNAILHLSKVLSYTIYKSKDHVIALTEELELLESLIGLYQLKFNNQLNIQFQIEERETNAQLQIPSLVLFSLLENAFKHANLSPDPKTFLFIKLTQDGKKLIFDIENSIPPTPKPTHNNFSSGLGFDAIKQLLKQHYGDSFSLETRKLNHSYKVILSIYEI